MDNKLKSSLIIVLFYGIWVQSVSSTLTCRNCLDSNTTLIVTCKSNGNTTDMCANDVIENCTLTTNCSIPVNINATSSYMISVPATTKSQTLWTNSIYSASPSIKPSPKPTSKSPNTTQKPHQPAKSGRRFDAASFIGGMLLCGGLILLVYIAVRCFRSRPDYHKL
ncbi:sialomucin core protein 24-like [Rhopilema esculentum]|uniref:sialomucin core protein 24-like n=1 Tax=Rhopilema esculentum TaxID=499914 RepID=UPI0031D8A7DD